MESLQQIVLEHQGNVCDKWSFYLEEYERIFTTYRDAPISLLEIGVQNGGSLEIWRKFFVNATTIIGCDIDPNCANVRFDDPRIAVIVADATTDHGERQILQKCSSFDIIIDDGSHRSSEIVRSFARYFKHLKTKGIYIVEDLHCSYWNQYADIQNNDGGLYYNQSAIGFFKSIIDSINHEHWGIDQSREEFLLEFQQHYGVDFSEEILRTIHRVEFSNSLCILSKMPAQLNTLGLRLVRGTAEPVQPGVRTMDGAVLTAPNQSMNEWSVRRDRPSLGGEAGEIKDRLEGYDSRIAKLEAVLGVADDSAPGQPVLPAIHQMRTELGAARAETGIALSRVSVAEAEAEAMRTILAAHRSELQAVRSSRDAAVAELSEAQEAISAAKADADAATKLLAEAEEQHTRARAILEEQVDDASRAKEEAERDRAGFEQELVHIRSSTLWQCTYLLRRLGSRVPRPLRRSLRRAAGVVWRAASRSPLGPIIEERPYVVPTVTAPDLASRHELSPEIVFVSGYPGSPSEAYRVFNPLSVLQNFYRTFAIVAGELEAHGALLKRAKIIVLFRVAWSPQLGQIVKEAQASGCLVVFDVDDYVFEPAIAVPKIIDGIRVLRKEEILAYHDGVKAYRKSLQSADCCILTNGFLADRAKELARSVYILPNMISPAMLQHYDQALIERRQRRRLPDEPLRIGYASGTLTHQRDFDVVRPVLTELLKQRDDCMLTLVGHIDIGEYPDLAALSDRIELRPPVPHDDLPKELARFDINIAPLEIGNPFCEAKSELKFFNAALVEVPTVASATAPFRDAIRDGESGFLASSEAEWRNALTKLLDDRRLRVRVGLRARGEALRLFGPSRLRTEVRLLFEELMALRRPQTPRRKAGYDHFLYAINYPAVQLQPPPRAEPSASAGGEPRELDIHWIVPHFGVGWGGMTNIFRIIQGLERSGHRSTLWVHNPPDLSGGQIVSDFYRDLITKHFPPVAAKIYPLPFNLDQISGDAVIATDHCSAYPARSIARVQRRFYFLQDNEPAFSPAGFAALFAENTYRFGFDALSNGGWLHALAQRYGMWSMKWEQAADPDYYFPPNGEARLPHHIAFYARQETPRRAVELGYLAFELLAREGFQFHVDLFGGEVAPKGLPFSHTHHGILSAAGLGELYRRATVGMVFSATNYSIIPREMMACGLPVIELDSESSRSAFPAGVAELADPTAEGVAHRLKALLGDKTRREQLAQRATEFLVNFSWERSARDIETALLARLGIAENAPACKRLELAETVLEQ
jgi:glycosyltransferase involved in cell wall biosynthesis